MMVVKFCSNVLPSVYCPPNPTPAFPKLISQMGKGCVCVCVTVLQTEGSRRHFPTKHMATSHRTWSVQWENTSRTSGQAIRADCRAGYVPYRWTLRRPRVTSHRPRVMRLIMLGLSDTSKFPCAPCWSGRSALGAGKLGETCKLFLLPCQKKTQPFYYCMIAESFLANGKKNPLVCRRFWLFFSLELLTGSGSTFFFFSKNKLCQSDVLSKKEK